jgi:hypothetical protein
MNFNAAVPGPVLNYPKGNLMLGLNAAPNPSFERTHTGMRQLAFISFWANCHTPVWAAQLKR